MYRLLSPVALMILVASGASAVPFQFFPADVQQVLNAVYASLPSDAQVLGSRAIGSLTPEQAQQAILNIRSGVSALGFPAYRSLASTLDQIRRALPSRFQQAFVNGVWGVSSQEELYATTVIEIVCIQSGAPRERCGPGAGGQVPQSQFSAPAGGFQPPPRDNPCYSCREDNLVRAVGGNSLLDCSRACSYR